MVYCKPVKITLDAFGLAEDIIDVVARQHGFSDSIVTNRGSLFTLKFWSSLCYFFGIKQRLFTAFHLQIDCQTGRQNSTMEAYLWAFVNFEQNDRARLLPMAEFAYNNAKNSSTGHTLFELNCGYHLCVSFVKTPILAPDRNQQTSYQRNYKIWWLFTGKTSIILKSFKNKTTIKASSLEATSPMTKFSWIANT